MNKNEIQVQRVNQNSPEEEKKIVQWFIEVKVIVQ
jgi:hypothetical protein